LQGAQCRKSGIAFQTRRELACSNKDVACLYQALGHVHKRTPFGRKIPSAWNSCSVENEGSLLNRHLCTINESPSSCSKLHMVALGSISVRLFNIGQTSQAAGWENGAIPKPLMIFEEIQRGVYVKSFETSGFDCG
jgi:hypothetical protein